MLLFRSSLDTDTDQVFNKGRLSEAPADSNESIPTK
jgi:hypothetical protein